MLPIKMVRHTTFKLDLQQIESLQFSIGPGIPENELEGTHGVAIERVWLE